MQIDNFGVAKTRALQIAPIHLFLSLETYRRRARRLGTAQNGRVTNLKEQTDADGAAAIAVRVTPKWCG